MDLEVDPKQLKCEKRREYERKEFMDNVVRKTGLAVSKLTPATAALATVTQRLKDHTNKLKAIESTLSTACGTTTQRRRRVLTQSRELLLSTLRDHPELAGNIEVSTPVCDFEKCTACGECVRLCPTNACDLLGSGRFALEPAYCVGCGLCAEACEDHALTMESHDASDLVVPDPDAEQKRKDAERARAEAEKAKAEAKVKLNKLLDQVEKLDD